MITSTARLNRAPRVILVCALSWLVVGCDGGDERQRGAAAPPVRETAEPAFSDFADLESGRTYTTGVFRPAIRFRVPEGAWTTEVGDTARHMAVAAADPPGPVSQAILAVHRIDTVHDPQRGGVVPGDLIPLEGSFADWLLNHPRLETTAPRDVELMGLSGVQIDVTGTRSAPPRRPDDCGKTGPRCVPLFYDGIDHILYTTTNRGRFTILQAPGGEELVVEQYVEPARAFERGIATLRLLLRSLALA